jgi:hypothetical protein
MNDARERLYENVEQCTPHGHRSKALDHAARYYLKMHGHNNVRPTAGAIEELLQLAEQQGSVTAGEIAECLNVEEYPVEVAVDISHGFDHE